MLLRQLWALRTAAVLVVILASAPTVSASSQPEIDAPIVRALELTNIAREQNGLRPLVLSVELSQAAHAYSVVLATSGCFAHDCGPMPDMARRLEHAGYTGWTAIAENIAAGYPTPEAVVQGWMSSPGHRANLLSPRYTEIGIGLVTSSGRFGTFWTQNFGSRRVIPAPPPAPGPVPEPELVPEAWVEPAPEPDIETPPPEEGGEVVIDSGE